MEDKYLSVITNFGCHYKCPECIVRENKLQIPKTTIKGLDNLEKAIKENNCNIVSLSGGGDPLYNFKNNEKWYLNFVYTCMKCNVKIEMHTSYVDLPDLIRYFYNNHFNRFVYHLHYYSELKDVKPVRDTITRVVFVVDKNMSKFEMIRIALYCKRHNYELSFRQFVDNHYETQYYNHDFLKRYHKKLWWYIEQNDYNLYYCENKIYTKYKEISVK